MLPKNTVSYENNFSLTKELEKLSLFKEESRANTGNKVFCEPYNYRFVLLKWFLVMMFDLSNE
jgi:hypothetical protein